MASPGAAIQAFWEPVTTTSQPQSSMANGTAPRAETLSTRLRAWGASARTAAADRRAEAAVAGGEDVAAGRLEAAGAGAGQDCDVAGRAEIRSHPVPDPAEHRRELGTSVIDHLACAGLAHAGRQGRRAGDPEVGLEAGHCGLQAAGLDAGPMVACDGRACIADGDPICPD